MALLVISKILGPYLNTFTADEKYSLANSENLWRKIQMQLSKKRETLSEFFSLFLKSTSNLEHFQKT